MQSAESQKKFIIPGLHARTDLLPATSSMHMQHAGDEKRPLEHVYLSLMLLGPIPIVPWTVLQPHACMHACVRVRTEI